MEFWTPSTLLCKQQQNLHRALQEPPTSQMACLHLRNHFRQRQSTGFPHHPCKVKPRPAFAHKWADGRKQMAIELPVNTWQKARPSVLFQPAILATVEKTTASFSGWAFPVWFSQTPDSLQKRKETRYTTNRHSSVVLFERQRVGSGGRETPLQVRADDRGRASEHRKCRERRNKKQERLLTKKTLAKKEKVFPAKKNVLILCSWYLKKHCRTFVFNPLILNPEGVRNPERPRAQCSEGHLPQGVSKEQ